MAGTIKNELGLLFKGDNYKVVKKGGNAGDLIPKHNHPGEDANFIMVKGKAKVFINDEEIGILEPGKVLNFDGANYINAEFIEDGEVVIVLAAQ